MRWLRWVALAVVVAAGLTVGAVRDGGPRTEAERVESIASEVRCPTCRGLSAAESDAKAAGAIRAEIRDRLRDGYTPDEIRAYLVSRYGGDALLRPAATGVAGLVWALPVAAFVIAVAGLAVALARWRRGGARPDEARAHAGRWALGGAAVLAVAALAGLAVSSAVGERLGSDQITGSVEEGSNAKIARAQQLVQDGEVLEAVKVYDDVLADDPDHPVALAQRGWLISRAGLLDEGLAYVDRAIASDARYVDARFFRAMILRDQGDADAATAELRALLALDPPAAMADLAADVLDQIESGATPPETEPTLRQ